MRSTCWGSQRLQTSIYPIVGWGVFVAGDAWSTFWKDNLREEKIERGDDATSESDRRLPRGREGPDRGASPGILVKPLQLG